MSSWMVVTSIDNFQRTIDLGFSKQGFKARQRKKVMEQMEAGDDLLYYVTGVQVFAATARITSGGFEEHELIWTSKPGEDYPWRVEVRPDRVLVEEDWIPTSEIAPGLEYVQKWPAAHWKLAFQGNLHRIPDHDFATVRDALAGGKRLAIAGAKRAGTKAAKAGAKGTAKAAKRVATSPAAKRAGTKVAKAGAKGTVKVAAKVATSPTAKRAGAKVAKAGAKEAVKVATSPAAKRAGTKAVKGAAGSAKRAAASAKSATKRKQA